MSGKCPEPIALRREFRHHRLSRQRTESGRLVMCLHPLFGATKHRAQKRPVDKCRLCLGMVISEEAGRETVRILTEHRNNSCRVPSVVVRDKRDRGMEFAILRRTEKGLKIQITIIPPPKRIINDNGSVRFARMPALLPEDVPQHHGVGH